MTNRTLAIQTLVSDVNQRKDSLYRALRAYTRDTDIDLEERWRVFAASREGVTYSIGMGLTFDWLRAFDRPNGSNHIVDALKNDARRNISRSILKGIPVFNVAQFLAGYVGREFPGNQLMSRVPTTFTATHLTTFKEYCLNNYIGKIEIITE